tara:strand:+ start:46 stop:690 length:645 start_codon:yes stop_codon:yes gene_type:complete
MAYKNKEDLKAWRAANKKRVAATTKSYSQTNKEKILAYQRDYYEANREKILAYQRDKYIHDEAIKEKILADSKAWKKANTERHRATNKAWYEANKERHRVTNKAWYEANLDKHNASSSRRRALKLKLIPKHLKNCLVEKQRIINIHKLRNLMINVTGIKHHIDHMWPLKDGGPEWSGNMQIITAHENLSKGSSVCPELKRNIKQSLKESANVFQ